MASTSDVETNRRKPGKKHKMRDLLHLSRKEERGGLRSPTSLGATNSLDLNQVEAALKSANNTYSEMRPVKSSMSTAFSNTMAIVGLNRGSEEASGSLVENLSAFASFVAKLGEVHPYARMALAIFTVISNAFIAQAMRDQAMKKLLDAMVDVYQLTRRYKEVEHLDGHRKSLLQKLSVQTVECAYYIREQALLRSPVKRTAKNIFFGSSIDERLTDYTNVFVDLRRCLAERGTLEVEIRIVTALSSIADQIELQELTNVRGSGVNSSKACLPGTRTEVLDELSAWVNDPDSLRIRFLLGFAGVGKSAVAHSLGARFASLRRLGSFFAFDRNFQGDRHPETVLKTIARDLARWNPAFRRELARVIREDGTLLHTEDIKTQWNELIVEPAKRVVFLGPVLIVIDAFDESSSADCRSRHILLRSFTESAEALPSNFRILVTSRPEHDVTSALTRSAHATATLHLEPSPQDVEMYVRYTLDPGDKFQNHLSETFVKLLVEKAAGVFQWAFTACRILLEDPSGLSLEERFDERLRGLVHGGASSLDDLYSETLDRIFPKSNLIVLSRFQSVMAHILCASRPLSTEELQIISSELDIEAKNDAPLVVHRMGAFLSGLDLPSSPIRPLHTSFRDFLLTESRSGRWYVDVLKGHSSICLALATHLNRHLRFNMFNISTSYLRSSQIPRLKERLESTVLAYAAHYFEDHIPPPSILPHRSLHAALRKLLCGNFLYWLEVLSVHGTVNTALSVLQKCLNYFAGADHEKKCCAFVQDAISFVRKFGRIIAQSIPHIYISALPFSPPSSLVRRTFHSMFPHQVLPDGIADNWSQTRTIISENSSVLSSISPLDGQRIVSGSEDPTMRIWDLEIGVADGKPFSGHSAGISSVTYSPDGRRIASGSLDSTVRIWDAETGEAVGEPFNGNTAAISSIAYSPDGRRIVSGSWDSAMRIWDAETGDTVGELFSGSSAAVSSVAYSPDGRWIVAGFWDSTVHVWEAETGEPVGESFNGHSASVRSVAYSPDSRRIVSGSHDSTMRIWDMDTGKVVSGSLEGHSAAICSVAYSLNGRRIASGSHDSTVRIWDAETGEAIGEPFYGHSSAVCSVAFSPDCRRIISGSWDTTVRIWDAETGENIGKLNGHISAVYSVSFSPDGRRIISGSSDSTVRVWDVETGKPIGEPLSGYSAAGYSVVYSPNGTRILSGSWDSTAPVCSAETDKAIGERFKGHSAAICTVAYSPDGRQIASGSHDSTVRIWDAETGKNISEFFSGHFSTVYSVAFSPDGQRIAAGYGDSTMCIWDVETGEFVCKPVNGHSAGLSTVVYSPDGRRIASGSLDSTVRIWDAETGEAVGGPFNSSSAAISSIAYSPDGRWIVSGSWDRAVRIWDAETGVIIGKPLNGHSAAVSSVAYSPNGRRIVSSSWDSTVRTWDAETGKAIGDPFKGHSAAVRSVAYSPNGKRIVSGSWDSMVRIWNAETGEPVGEPFKGHSAGVVSVAYSPCGQQIVSSSYDSTIRVFGSEMGSQVESQSAADSGWFIRNLALKKTFGASMPQDAVRHLEMIDGWIVDGVGNLILWVPHEYRNSLWWPGMRLLIGGRRPSLTIDFKDAKIGPDWVQIAEAVVE